MEAVRDLVLFAGLKDPESMLSCRVKIRFQRRTAEF